MNSAKPVWRVEEMAEAAIAGGHEGRASPKTEQGRRPHAASVALFSDYVRCCQKEQVGCEHEATFDCEPGHYFR